MADLVPGEVAEWSNAPHSKCGIGASLSGVRIPPSPPISACPDLQGHPSFVSRWVRAAAERAKRLMQQLVSLCQAIRAAAAEAKKADMTMPLDDNEGLLLLG
jgi:hypothetical protein